MHEHDNAVTAGLSFVAGERSAKCRGYVEHREKTRRRVDHLNLDRASANAERHGALTHHRYRFKALSVLLPHHKMVCIDGERRIDIAELCDLLFDHDDLLRVPIRQRLQHDVVVKRKDGCRCPNTKGKG